MSHIYDIIDDVVGYKKGYDFGFGLKNCQRSKIEIVFGISKSMLCIR